MRMWCLCCLGLGVLLTSQAWADGCNLKDYGTLPVDMVDGQTTTMVSDIALQIGIEGGAAEAGRRERTAGGFLLGQRAGRCHPTRLQRSNAHAGTTRGGAAIVEGYDRLPRQTALIESSGDPAVTSVLSSELMLHTA